ncbi:MAG: FAD-dependent oxidoreductase [Clostridia bacterium]|nr:FAD-dependent oxidoreductase [Clostridia bacterium]
MKQNSIVESLSTPIKDKASVIVAGGGVAGIAAAIAAARNGADVLLIENQFSLGGLATLGLVTYYLPICDGRGHQIIYGLGEELLRLSVKRSHEWHYPVCWFEGGPQEEKNKRRFEAGFNPIYFSIDAEQLLLKAGARILYGTKICASRVEDGKITALIVENKTGRYAIECNCVIDTTGDADIAYYSGAETALYAEGNKLAAWHYYLCDGDRQLKMYGASDVATNEPADETPNIRFSGVDGQELSDITVISHRYLIDYVVKRQKDFPDYQPITMASIPQVRMTRRIVGKATLDMCEDEERIFVEDSIGVTGNWRRRGPVYEIPFGAICSANIKNLLAAGRDISVTDKMWNITRVIPVCALTGESAGICAAMLADCDYDTANVDITALQENIKKNGVRIHINEVL